MRKKVWDMPKRQVNGYIRLKIEKMLVNYLKKQPSRIKEALKDPDMCKCVQNKIDSMVDEYWPDV